MTDHFESLNTIVKPDGEHQREHKKNPYIKPKNKNQLRYAFMITYRSTPEVTTILITVLLGNPVIKIVAVY